jgi:hypothetical protein
MKSVVEQVDSFVEGVFDGSIISIFQTARDNRDPPSFLSSLPEEAIHQVADEVSRLFNKMIPNYVQLTNVKDKKAMSHEIFALVIRHRAMSIIQNNPNNLKELGFYKSENNKLKEENERLTNSVKDLATKIIQLAPSKDQKVGVT